MVKAGLEPKESSSKTYVPHHCSLHKAVGTGCQGALAINDEGPQGQASQERLPERERSELNLKADQALKIEVGPQGHEDVGWEAKEGNGGAQGRLGTEHDHVPPGKWSSA